MSETVNLKGSVQELDVLLKGIDSVFQFSTGLLKLVHLRLKSFYSLLLLPILGHEISELLFPCHGRLIVPVLESLNAFEQPCNLKVQLTIILLLFTRCHLANKYNGHLEMSV